MVVPAVFRGLPLQLEMCSKNSTHVPQPSADPIQPETSRPEGASARTGADIGLAFDGDADRVFLVDEQARPVSGSRDDGFGPTSVLDSNPARRSSQSHLLQTVPDHPRARRHTDSHAGRTFVSSNRLMAGPGCLRRRALGHYYFRENYRATPVSSPRSSCSKR